jgi:hypothetical protein
MPACRNWFALPVLALLAGLLAGADPVTVPEGKTVTLAGNNVKLSQALAELAERSGIRVENRLGADPGLRLNIQGRPFWEALDTLAAAAGARVYVSPRDRVIALVKRTGRLTPPVSYSGPFRLALKRVVPSWDFDADSRQTTVTLEVCWEPALQPFLLETRPQDLVVKDQAGKAIPVTWSGSSLAPVDGRIALQFDVTLPPFPRTDRTIGLVEGKLSAIGPSKMLHFAFDTLERLDKAAPGSAVRKKAEEGISCNVSKMTLAADRWTIQVTLDAPPGARLESFQSWVVNNEMMLVDPNNPKRRFVSTDYVLESASERRAVISYNFRDRDGLVRGKPGDWVLHYTTPASVVVMSIPFRFKDVPLP